jgi:hypothetical protein
MIIIQFFIYLCVALNCQRAVTESAQIQTAAAARQHMTKHTQKKKNRLVKDIYI